MPNAHADSMNDPIVEEVRRSRREYFAECGNDLDRMFDDLQRRQAEHPERLADSQAQPPRVNGRHKKSA